MNVEIFKMSNKTDSNSGGGINFPLYLYSCALTAALIVIFFIVVRLHKNYFGTVPGLYHKISADQRFDLLHAVTTIQ